MAFIRRAAMVLLLFFICIGASLVQASAASKTLSDSDGGTISDPNTTYTIKGSGSRKTSTKYFDVPEGKSSQSEPIVIILESVNITQEDKSPDHSFIHIEGNNYVIIKLKNKNYIRAWSRQEKFGSNDGMSAVHVSKGSTVKITSYDGDGSTSGILEARGGGGKYGGAAIGARYNAEMGTVIIAGGTITARGGTGAAGIGSGRNDTKGYENDVQITGGKVGAYGGDEGAGIGSGRDGKAYSISISGGEVYAQGGKYAAGIGGGNAVGGGSGGNIVDLTITGGKVEARGGKGGAGIGCSDEGEIEGGIRISSSSLDITAIGGDNGAGIGGGNSSNLDPEDLIDISGSGTVYAYGGSDGAGIGGGNDGSSSAISIVGSSNGQHGSRGEAPSGSRTLDITATAGKSDQSDGHSFGNEAAAIGSGRATGGDINIQNAVLHTRADNQGADIGGGGYHVNPNGTVKNITINNCEITSTSTHKVAPGIGSGYGGSVDTITITNTRYSGGSIGGAPMDVPYTGLNDVKTITIDNSDISAVWDEANPGSFTGGYTPSTEPYEHGAAGIGSGQYGSMDTIKITNSKVVAHGYGSGSGIGAGGAGGNGFTFLDLTKWSVGDTGYIEISNSSVDAHSGKAHFDPHSPITYWDGHVWIEIDNPMMFGGGAGIGGGSASNTGKIWIHDIAKGDKIKAVGDGAGIGSGEGTGDISKGAVDYIWLENIDDLYAEAGSNSAGIGTGGSEGGLDLWAATSGALKQIFIKNCNIEARGGEFGAGIGLGCRSPYLNDVTNTEKSDWPMEIIDSDISAFGGCAGAGIGGGFEDYTMNIGGENPRLHIKGKCRISAIGGPEKEYEDGVGMHGGGAGIGGGCCGAGSYIEIDLEEKEVYDQIAKGSINEPELSGYYVYAEGGGGGAGIGSGGKTWDERYINLENADTDTVVIKHGAVFAKGSRSVANGYRAHVQFNLGAGAGIGGGSFGSGIKNLLISGGYVQAVAGDPTNSRDAADDIGAGGIPSKRQTVDESDRKCGMFEITDGTVLCDTFGTFTEERRIAGGSVSAVIKGGATRGAELNDTPVYMTQMRVPVGYEGEKIDNLKVYIKDGDTKSYGSSHIYTDNRQGKDGYVYLYLEEQGAGGDPGVHKQCADVELNLNGKSNKWNYSGYTDTDNTGVLKMDGGEIPFRVVKANTSDTTIRQGDDFSLVLQDDNVPPDTLWIGMTASGCASITDAAGTEYRSRGATVGMHADSVGGFTVSSDIEDYNEDPTRYWNSRAWFEGAVLKKLPAITITEDVSKVYDAQSVEDPAVSTESPGAVTYEYFTDEDCEHKTTAEDGASPDGGAPRCAGEYRVKATVAETSGFDSNSAKKSVTITKATTHLSVELNVKSGNTVTAVVSGLYEENSGNYGRVKFTFSWLDGTQLRTERAVAVTYDNTTKLGTATVEIPGEIKVKKYTIDAVYEPLSRNYLSSVQNGIDVEEDPDTRRIEGVRLREKTYGDGAFDLGMTASADPDVGSWSYTIVYDSFPWTENIREEDKTVSVSSSGRVTINHAGRAVIEVKLTGKNQNDERIYYDEKAYVTVDVSKADLDVTSQALEGGSQGTPVTELLYGSINDRKIKYTLEYSSFKGNDNAGNFTHGHGTLKAVPLAEMTEASPAQKIRIERCGVGNEPFFSRDYKIKEHEGTVRIKKRTINIDVENATGIYAVEPAYSWKIAQDQTGKNGKAWWDSEATIFTEPPKITIQTGESYKSLDKGTYHDILGVSSGNEGASNNYIPSFDSGDLKIEPADISDADRFHFGVDRNSMGLSDIVYNGRVQKRDIIGLDYAFGEDSPKDLRLYTDYTEKYNDRSTMIDAGMVRVKITGKGNYTGETYARYLILRKPLLVKTESAAKIYDGKPLTAPGEMRGLVPGETATLKVTGSQTDIGASWNTYDLTFGTAKKSNYVVASGYGKLVVMQQGNYSCVKGAGATWKKGSKKSLPFTFKRSKRDIETCARFRSVMIDGKEVPEDMYTVRPGSAVITLKPEYLQKLKVKKHKMEVRFSDGSAKVSFTVKKGGSPDTGDEKDLTLWIALMILSAAELGVLALRRIRS